jgi:salicylate hydroxylase
LSLNIAIVGGGTAGLTAALAFAKNGHEITVFERAKRLEEIGAGIQLSPNANKVLVALGLFEAIKAISFEPETLQLVDGNTGKTLSNLPFKAMMKQRYGAPYLVTYRGDLQSVLLQSAQTNPLIHIQTGTLINRFKELADGVEIADKKFDLLVVADGIGSTLRSDIDPNAEVISARQTAWRATLPIGSDSQNAVNVYMNAGSHLVTYQMGARPVLNLVFVAKSDRPPSAKGFGEKAGELLKAAKDWKAWPLESVESNTWHKGHAVMIGDAAHAMTPHAAQGGALAIGDAMELANCVNSRPTIEAAFEAYQAARQPRIARVRTLSAQNRAIYQMGGFIALGRNLTMPFIPPSLLLKRLDWLYGWEA